jgi:hypothetical protein
MPRSGSLIPALVYAAVLFTPLTASGQNAPAGVVTALQGPATVVRTATTEPAPLKFKDDVFVHDRIRTGNHATVRILLGGRATVTVRERSVLTITEHPGVSQINVGAGRAAIAAVKSRMKPGETIDIVTPNAVATIRGTVVVAEVSAAGSTFTVLRGLVDVTQLDPATRRPLGVALHVGPLQRVNVPAGAAPKAQTLTPEAGQRLGNQFKVGPRETPAAVHESMTESQVRTAVDHVSQLSASKAVPSTEASPSASVAGREEAKGGETASTARGGDSKTSTSQPVKSSTAVLPATAPSVATSTSSTAAATTPAATTRPVAIPPVTTPVATTPPVTIAPVTTPTLTTPALTNGPSTTPPGLLSAPGLANTPPGQLVTRPPATLPGQQLTSPAVPTNPLGNNPHNLLGTPGNTTGKPLGK